MTTPVARRVAVIGAGYVGLTAAACLASLGHLVRCVDNDEELVGQLRGGSLGIDEPGLGDLVLAGLASGDLRFGVDACAAAAAAEVTFLCLPTPAGAGGAPDLSHIELVADDIANALPAGACVVIKSTVPPGTAAKLSGALGRPDVTVVSNPEFLREGSAVRDFLHPDRIVVGADTEPAAARVVDLYRAVRAPVVVTSTASAELAKYAANCFLALRLTYVNELAELCERTGAHIGEVTSVIAADHRIAAAYLLPGPGWGGPCLPKDTRALLNISSQDGAGSALLDAALRSNERQHHRLVEKVRWAAGGTLSGANVGLLGLTFKAHTNDLRDSPALAVAGLLAAERTKVTGYDPTVRGDIPGIAVAHDPYAAVTRADVVVVLTDWPEFRCLDWQRAAQLMTGRTVIDARNHLDAALLDRAGLRWQGTGVAAAI